MEAAAAVGLEGNDWRRNYPIDLKVLQKRGHLYKIKITDANQTSNQEVLRGNLCRTFRIPRD